jgi:hypothetical protein
MRYARTALTLWLALGGICAISRAQFHTNVITTPNSGIFNYSVDGSAQTCPTFNLSAGVTNILRINVAGSHPVVITTNLSAAMTSYYNGASPENISSGAIALRIPATGFPGKLYYYCSVHLFHGEIDISAPVLPAPPRNRVLSVRVGTNIVMTSTGTNTTWLLIPEFSSNLLGGVWAPVPSYTNSFANGTNTTVFNRLDPICGPNVYLRVRQQLN